MALQEVDVCNKKLICIEYPGNVQNVDKMVSTLGGINSISGAYSDKKRRLELRFRPDDIYSKPVCGDRHKTSAILFKITVKRKKKSGEITKCSVDIEGVVESVYKFTCLCDFQYLPVSKNGLIYDKLVPKGLLDFSWIQGDVDVFLPPAAFTRVDSMQSYHYRNNVQDRGKISFVRKPRQVGMGYFISWNDQEIPKGPRDVPQHLMLFKALSQPFLVELKKAFEIRPIWSKNALICCTSINRDQLKILLPCVAYYFTTGPWRVMWVKFGYDPRTDPSARIYQTLDYRLPTTGGLRMKVQARRSYSNYILPYKSSACPRPKASIITPNSYDDQKPGTSKKKDRNENLYIFRPGMIPPSRQMFYQYCDLHVPEIQDMLLKLPQLSAGTKCDEKMGWLPKGMDLQCRHIIHEKAIEASQMLGKSTPTDIESMPNREDEDGSENSEHFDSDFDESEDEIEQEK